MLTHPRLSGMLKKHSHCIKLVWFAVSWLQAFVINTPYNHCIKVHGWDGHTPNTVVHPSGILIISAPISVGIQDRAQEDVNGAGICP